MSFLFDDKSIATILASIGAKETLKNKNFKGLIKVADSTAAQLAIPYLVNLQRKIDPASSQISVTLRGSQLGSTRPATVADFRKLGDFLRFSATNQLTWNNQRFAWTENDPSIPADKSKLWDLTGMVDDRAAREKGTRRVLTENFVTNKDGLVAYLTSIRDNEANGNRVLQVMIKNLIQELNRELVKVGSKPISTTSTTAAATTAELDKEAVVDGFGTSNLLSLDNWNVGLSAHPNFESSSDQYLLKVKDLASFTSFTEFLKKFLVRTVEVDNKGNRNIVTLNAVGSDSDPCLAVHILYKRATELKSLARSDEAEKPGYVRMVDLYLKAVQDFGSKFTDKNGRPCAVTTARAAATSPSSAPLDILFDPNEPEEPGRGGGRGRGGRGYGEDTGVTAQTLSEIITNLPLNETLISENKIYRFLGYIDKIMPRETGAARNVIDPRFRTLSQAFTGGQADLVLGRDAKAIEASMNDYINDYCNAIQKYKEIVDAVIVLISQFKEKYNKQILDNETWRVAVFGQVGATESDSYSIGKRNIARLKYLHYSGNSKCAQGLF